MNSLQEKIYRGIFIRVKVSDSNVHACAQHEVQKKSIIGQRQKIVFKVNISEEFYFWQSQEYEEDGNDKDAYRIGKAM